MVNVFDRLENGTKIWGGSLPPVQLPLLAALVGADTPREGRIRGTRGGGGGLGRSSLVLSRDADLLKKLLSLRSLELSLPILIRSLDRVSARKIINT